MGNLAEAEDARAGGVRPGLGRGRAPGSERVDNPEAWLRRTAINLHRNRWRKLRNFGRIRPRLDELTGRPARPREHVAVIEGCRAELPEAQREAVALHYLADRRCWRSRSCSAFPSARQVTTMMPVDGAGRAAVEELTAMTELS